MKIKNKDHDESVNIMESDLGEISFITGDQPVIVLKPSGEFLINGKEVATDLDLYDGLKAWLKQTVNDTLDDEQAPTVAYVFNKFIDKDSLKAFSDNLNKSYEIIPKGSHPDDEPTVIYTFRAFRDQYELAEFQKGPNYGRAIDTFGRWLREQWKYAPEDLDEKEYKAIERIWDKWWEVLNDEDAIGE